jgi:hypothetical protein
MSEEDNSDYEDALEQNISLHVVHDRVHDILELYDPDHPEYSDINSFYDELKKFREELLRMIGENANLVWYIDQSRKQKE